MFYADAPLQVKQGLLEFCQISVEHYHDSGFQQKIDNVKRRNSLFANEYGFMDFKDNYVCSEDDEKELDEMIMTLDIYQEIVKLSVRIIF